MRKFNFIYLLLAFVGAVTMSSCEHKYADWAPGAKDANMGVYFDDISNVIVKAEDTSATILVKRSETAEAAVIKVRSEDVEKCGFFTVPSDVVFDADSDTAELVVTFNGADLTPGALYPIRIQLDQEQASIYGTSEAVFKFGIAEPWKSLGMGSYRDDFIGPMYGSPAGAIIKVEIFQHELEPSRYRIYDPFTLENCATIIGAIPEDMTFTDGDAYIEFVIAEDNTVTIPSSPLGFKLDVGTGQLEDFFLESYGTLTGTFRDGVVSFETPASILWHIADGRGNYANNDGLFAIALPGYVIADHNISAAYTGGSIGDDNTSASAIVEFVVGSDVTSFRFAAVAGVVEDLDAVVDEIVNNAEESELAIYESAADETVWALNLEKGLYTLVMVPYGVDGAVLNKVNTYYFYYPGYEADLPEAKFAVGMGAASTLLGDPAYEESYPSEYFTLLYIVGNAYEVKHVSVYINYEFSIDPNATNAELAAKGTDYTDDVLKAMTANRGQFIQDFQIESGAPMVAVVAIQTVYGNINYYRVKYTMPYSGDIALGSYTLTETITTENNEKIENTLPVALIGGLKEGEVNLVIPNFNSHSFTGVADAEKGTITFPGIIDGGNYGYNTLLYYTDATKTEAYGFWSSKTPDFKEAAPLVCSFNEEGVLTTLDNHFGCFVFNLVSGEQTGVVFYFSPEATFVPVVETPETPETPEAETSMVKSLFQASSSKIEAKVYTGEVVRECKSTAVIR